MRSREEVLTEYNIERDEEDGCLILPQHRDTIINALADRIRELESPPRPEPVAWVAPHNTLYLFDGYEFTIITRRPDGKLSFSGGDDLPENFDDEVGAAGIYRFVGSVHSAEGWTSEQCEAAGIPSDASNYSEWWNGHMEDATLADVAHVFGIPHPSVPPQRGDRGPADLAAAGAEVVEPSVIGGGISPMPTLSDLAALAEDVAQRFDMEGGEESAHDAKVIRTLVANLAPVVELDEWRVVDKDGKQRGGSDANYGGANWWREQFDKASDARAPHRVMRVCLRPADSHQSVPSDYSAPVPPVVAEAIKDADGSPVLVYMVLDQHNTPVAHSQEKDDADFAAFHLANDEQQLRVVACHLTAALRPVEVERG